MVPTREELLESKRQIDSTIHKLKESVKTMEGKENAARLKSQITLANRRVKAFKIANYLVDRELGGQDKIVTGAASEEIARKLNCEMFLYDDLGHAAYEEAADFNQKVYTFLMK